MFAWLGKLFSPRTAAEAARKNPVLAAAVKKSSLIYNQIPLRDFVSEETRKSLARQLYLEINEICNAIEPVTACREKLAIAMLDTALFQVLVIPPAPEKDETGLRGEAGVSGELKQHLMALSEKSGDLQTELRTLESPASEESIWQFVQQSYWTKHWFLESINATRIELQDYTEREDWFRPFMHAACANREHAFRRDLDISPSLDEEIAGIAPTAYSIFTDIVVSGAKNPIQEWREYCNDVNIPIAVDKT